MYYVYIPIIPILICIPNIDLVFQYKHFFSIINHKLEKNQSEKCL